MMKIIARFYLRGLLFCHYDTLEAIGLALQDVLDGPDYFAANADMSARHKQIGGLTDAERWRPVDEQPARALRRRINPDRWLPRMVMKLTLNGHFMPGFRSFGNQLEMGADKRGRLRRVRGASELTYVTADGTHSYTVTHSKRCALATSLPIMRAAWTLWRSYDKVRDNWHTGYDCMTKQSFWQKLLKVETQPKSPDA